MSLNIVWTVILLVILQCFLYAESRIVITNKSYKDVLINIPDLLKFNTAHDHFVSVYIMRTSGSKEEIIESRKEIREGDLQSLPPGFIAQIEFAADFFLEPRDQDIALNLLLEPFSKTPLLRVLLTRSYCSKKLKLGELVILPHHSLAQIALRAWYVIREDMIFCEYYYPDKED